MSASQTALIQAIRRIAKTDPDIQTLLREFQKRGSLRGALSHTAPGDDENCCDDPDVIDIGGPDDPGGGGRNPDGSWSPPGSDPDTEWNDCETGEPISFDPAGFPQPETCKECSSPDPDWQEGYYWRGRLDISGQSFASPGEAYAAWPMNKSRYIVRIQPGTASTLEVIAYYETEPGETGGYAARIALRSSCPSSSSNPEIQEVCSATEAPMIEDCQDWEPDSTTNLTLANGCITASSCDTDASEQAKQCNECINMCDSAGNQWTVCATGDGGFVAYDPSGEKDGVKYDYNGNPQSTIPAGSGRGIF